MKIRTMPLVLLLALAVGPIATAQTDAPSVDPSQAKQLEYLEEGRTHSASQCFGRQGNVVYRTRG
jgi:hypothetical protein